ncbi:MAG: hypothetical protein U0930_17050 [Pirellulales bacterium]
MHCWPISIKNRTKIFLVFAAKTLGKLKLKKARESMVKLLKHSSWRVRAATIDAIAESMEGKLGYSGTTSIGLSDDLVEGVLQALQDSDSFVVHRSSSLLPKIIDSRNAAKFITVLIKNGAAVDALVRSENYGESTDGKTLADAALKLLNSNDSAERLGAIRLISRLSPKHLMGRATLLSEMLDQEGEQREVALKASIGILEAMRDGVLKYDHENSASYQASSSRSGSAPKLQTEPWYPIPESMQSLPKKEKKQPAKDSVRPNTTSIAETSNSAPPAKQDEVDDLFGSVFGDKPELKLRANAAPDSKQGQNVPTTSEPELANSSATPENTETAGKADPNSLDSIDGFFGAAPKQETTTPKANATIATELQIETGEDLFEEAPKTPQAKRRVQQAREDKKNPNYGLTSFRINQYFDCGPTAFDIVPDGGYTSAIAPKDIAEVAKLSEKIRNLQSQADVKKQARSDLLEVASVVCGNQSIADQLVDRLLHQMSQEDTSRESKNLLKAVLPWANAKVRLKLLQNLKLNFARLDPVLEEILDKATFVDDYAMADWLFEQAKQLSDRNLKQEFTNEEAKTWNTLRKFLQRSLFGTNCSLDERWIYDHFDADFITPAQILPLGTIQSIKWMQKSFNATESTRVRASLLANLTFVDSMTARETAIGYLAQATVFENPLTDVAIQIGLNDDEPLTLDRAVQLLGHPIRQVRKAALEKLTTLKESNFSHNDQGLILKLKYTYDVPDSFGFSNTIREVSATDVEKLVAEFSTDKSNASENRYQALALQLLVTPQMSIDNCIDQTRELESRSLVAALLVKLDRNDEDANQFFAKTVELFNNHPSVTINNQPSIARELKSSVKALYASLKKLRGADYAKLRTDLRKRYSTILDN